MKPLLHKQEQGTSEVVLFLPCSVACHLINLFGVSGFSRVFLRIGPELNHDFMQISRKPTGEIYSLHDFIRLFPVKSKFQLFDPKRRGHVTAESAYPILNK